MIQLIKIGTETFIGIPGEDCYLRSLVNLKAIVEIHVGSKDILPDGKTQAIIIKTHSNSEGLWIYDNDAKILMTVLGVE